MAKEYRKILIALLPLFSSGCIKDKPPVPENTLPSGKPDIYIVCEGNYGNGNGTLYAYNSLKDSVYGDLYSSANASQPLGDVFQSMTRIDNHYFLVVNNSNKIVVVDTGTYRQAATISLPQPRYILQTLAGKAYVTTIWSSKVYVINTSSYTVSDTIILPSRNPETICLYNGYALVTSWDTADKYIYKVDIHTDKITDSMAMTGRAPQEILTDKEGLIWVLSGDQPLGKTATLTHLDPSTGAVLDSFTFPSLADPIKPVFNPTNDTLYFIETPFYGGTAYNGIYRMSIYDKALPTTPFIAGVANQYFYALGIDPVDGKIYIGDPRGFVQQGLVYVYRPDGTKISQFQVGLGPGHFYFAAAQ